MQLYIIFRDLLQSTFVLQIPVQLLLGVSGLAQRSENLNSWLLVFWPIKTISEETFGFLLWVLMPIVVVAASGIMISGTLFKRSP